MRRVLVGAKFRDFFLLISIYIEDSKTNLKIFLRKNSRSTKRAKNNFLLL